MVDRKKKDRMVYGWGVNDADYVVTSFVGGKQRICTFYNTWSGMIERCYSKKYKNKFPTYTDCSVCEEWRYFSNFKRWMETQDWEGKQLDKDMLFPLNKVYSPRSCVFIEQKLNSFLTSNTAKRGKYPLGSCFHKASGKFTALCNDRDGKQKHLGLFSCPNEAHEAYRQYKHKLACKYADEQTDPRIAHALRQWYKPNGWYKIKETN